MLTLLAFAILAGSALMVVGNLPMVASDTLALLKGCASRAHAAGQLHRRLAFVALWLLIFTLGYTA